MDLSQAASGALAMWHLMMPPAAHTPLSDKWIRSAVYESVEDCERSRIMLDRRAHDMRIPLRLVRESPARDRFHRWQVSHAVCVRSDDPRLSR
jgi:hypothetical protein